MVQRAAVLLLLVSLQLLLGMMLLLARGAVVQLALTGTTEIGSIGIKTAAMHMHTRMARHRLLSRAAAAAGAPGLAV
jgi:hypothetical protein